MKMFYIGIIIIFIGVICAYAGLDEKGTREESVKIKKENKVLKDNLRAAEGRLKRLTPLVYPFMIDDKILKIITVEYRTEILNWQVHEFHATEFMWDWRKYRDQKKKEFSHLTYSPGYNVDSLALVYIERMCKRAPGELMNGSNEYYMLPIINLMNYDITKEHYDWHAKKYESNK